MVELKLLLLFRTCMRTTYFIDHAVISYSFVNVVVLYNGTLDVCVYACVCLGRVFGELGV